MIEQLLQPLANLCINTALYFMYRNGTGLATGMPWGFWRQFIIWTNFLCIWLSVGAILGIVFFRN